MQLPGTSSNANITSLKPTVKVPILKNSHKTRHLNVLDYITQCYCHYLALLSVTLDLPRMSLGNIAVTRASIHSKPLQLNNKSASNFTWCPLSCIPKISLQFTAYYLVSCIKTAKFFKTMILVYILFNTEKLIWTKAQTCDITQMCLKLSQKSSHL